MKEIKIEQIEKIEKIEQKLKIKNSDELQEKFFNFLLKKTYTKKQAIEFLEKNQIKIPDDKKNILITEAENLGLIDDEAYAKLFAEGHEKWGNLKISFELSQRGISRENIETALSEIPEESERAEELAKSWENLIDNKKIARRLIQRGFSSRAIKFLKI